MKEDENIILWLMSNKDFRDWVLEPNELRDLYWQKWIEANPDKKEAVHRANRAIQKLKLEEKSLSDDELATILQHIIEKEQYPDFNRPRQNRKNLWLQIAASLVFLLTVGGVFYFLSSQNNDRELHSETTVKLNTVENPKGRKSMVRLPDGSSVYLNAQSRLVFPPQFSDSVREVALEGEAFFEITKDEKRPFRVRTEDLKAEVLGTSFNCRAFDDEPEVKISLVTGKIRIRPDNLTLPEHLLNAGDRLVYDKLSNSVTKSSFDIEEETGWKDGILIFSNDDFPEFVDKLEAWYGVEITVINKPKKAWNVNGRFQNESLEEVLIGVRFTYDIEYEITGKRVVMKIK